MNISIQDAINGIDEQIEELKKQKEVIANFDINEPIDENKWHIICETDLRYSDSVMTAITKKLFPNAENIIVHCNYVYFDLYGFKIQIPTSRQVGINVDLSWYSRHKNSGKPTLYLSLSDQRRLKYYEYCDKGYKWNKKAKIICGGWNSKLVLFINYLFEKTKYNEKDRAEFEKEYNEGKKRYEEKLKEYEAKNKKITEKVKLFKEKALPEINSFSTKHYIFDGSCSYNNITIEQMLKNEGLA